MEDEKEVVSSKVWFEFHNICLPSFFVLCSIFLKFHFISRPTDTINLKTYVIFCSLHLLSFCWQLLQLISLSSSYGKITQLQK